VFLKTIMKTKPFVMTPDHERWEEFCERLEGPEGCDFRPDHTWKCNNKGDRPFATKILEDMGADVVKSLAYFSAHGGHCDCEILFNVYRS